MVIMIYFPVPGLGILDFFYYKFVYSNYTKRGNLKLLQSTQVLTKNFRLDFDFVVTRVDWKSARTLQLT